MTQGANGTCPRLIEVALPIREISAESVRDKSLRHGHIATLHLWWARRPLAAARAVVFASLVPDPDDPRCPATFCTAVERHLRDRVPTLLREYRRGRNVLHDPDPYRPYDGIPDTPRNRLLAFIAKWSPEALDFEAGRTPEEPKPGLLLDDRSLVKWETSDPENQQGSEVLRIARELIKVAYNGEAPSVLDPFAGGGAIPLEAGRLGCQPIANDYNPVAHLILRATCEFPQKYGRPGKRKVLLEEFGRGVEREIDVPNVLAHDVEWWSNWTLERARERIGHLYPPGKDGLPVVGYFWARTAPCSNPSCRSEIPLLRSLILCDLRSKTKKVALTMEVNKAERNIRFGIVQGKRITQTEGTMQKRGNALCPFCEQITPVTDLRAAGSAGKMNERMVAVIVEDEKGKSYRPVEETDLAAYRAASHIKAERPTEVILPEINGPSAPPDAAHYRSINVDLYGLTTWGSLFNHRQLVAMQTLVGCVRDACSEMALRIEDPLYREAIAIYLGLAIDRVAQRGSNVGIWHTRQETFEHPFGRQAIPMTWDYPEANPFSETAQKTISAEWITRVITRESGTLAQSRHPAIVLRDDAAQITLAKPVDVVVADPPYFDAIAYADLSDFFYVWLKRSLVIAVPGLLATPLTPKEDEATALKHRHDGDEDAADEHFTTKLSNALTACRRSLRPCGISSIMFAHQSTKAWTALVHSTFEAGLAVDATWPIDTEKTYALKTAMSVLSSSITVACRARGAGSAMGFRDVRREIESTVRESVKRFWSYGLRGADLIVACYGPAVGVFGRYERVERADGTVVEVPELLELARKAARDAIAGEFRGDNLSTLYYVWANLYGAAEQAWDDARLVVQIGGESDNAMEVARGADLFVLDGQSCRLALLADRADRRALGEDRNPPLIDALHRAMLLWQQERRAELVTYLAGHDLLDDGPFWKLTQALFEVLPRDTADWKLVGALLGERATLRTEGRRITGLREAEGPLFADR